MYKINQCVILFWMLLQYNMCPIDYIANFILALFTIIGIICTWISIKSSTNEEDSDKTIPEKVNPPTDLKTENPAHHMNLRKRSMKRKGSI